MKKIIIAVLLIAIASTANAFESPDYGEPIAGWTPEELQKATLDCVSRRISLTNTETATLMLEKICYYEAINAGRYSESK